MARHGKARPSIFPLARWKELAKPAHQLSTPRQARENVVGSRSCNPAIGTRTLRGAARYFHDTTEIVCAAIMLFMGVWQRRLHSRSLVCHPLAGELAVFKIPARRPQAAEASQAYLRKLISIPLLRRWRPFMRTLQNAQPPFQAFPTFAHGTIHSFYCL